MEQTYLCKFDANGRRTETLLTCEFTEEKKAEKLEQGYIEISEEDWNYYVGNKGQGANGTGYVRGADGKPTDAPAYVPSKEEQLAQLDSQYNADKDSLVQAYLSAQLYGDEDLMTTLKTDLSALDEKYDSDYESIVNEEE